MNGQTKIIVLWWARKNWMYLIEPESLVDALGVKYM
jgi:hypothetical protein